MMPELFRIGPIPVHTYGLMWMVGIWLAVWRALRVARRYGVDPDDVFDLAFWAILVGVIGGRLGYVLIFWRSYAEDPLAILRVWEGGMSYFGGFGLAILAAWWFVRRRRLDAWRIADLAAPSIALGYAIARIGCFGAGCCYGAPTDLPWGVLFPGHSHPVHPTQLYSTNGTGVGNAGEYYAFADITRALLYATPPLLVLRISVKGDYSWKGDKPSPDPPWA